MLECPKSGFLWALSIFLESKATRKSKIADALKKCENDPYILVATARIFWMEKSLDKAKGWFEQAIASQSDIGDSWAWYFLFLRKEYPDTVDEFFTRFESTDPKHGLLFPSVAKDIKNWKKPKREILQLAAEYIEKLSSFVK